MRTLFILLMLFTINSFSQDSLKVTINGVTLGTIKTTLSNQIVFSRTIEWVNQTFQNPDKVITGKIEGKSININGYLNNAWYYTSLGIIFYYNMNFNIYFNFYDSIVTFKIEEGKHYSSDGRLVTFNSKSFFKSNGSYKNMYNTALPTLENSINSLWFSYINKLNDTSISSDEALVQLKKAKDKLDLGLIRQDEYDKLKLKLMPFIK